jgi:hypothetical protein
MPVSVEPARTDPSAPSPAGIRGAAVTTTIGEDLTMTPAVDGSVAKKGLQVSSAAPTPTSRPDHCGRRAGVTLAALS